MVGLHVLGFPNAPLQQYSGLLNASQALLQASPFATRSSAGHLWFRSTVHPVAMQAPLGCTIIGRLYLRI
jgi:hypothetical protein